MLEVWALASEARFDDFSPKLKPAPVALVSIQISISVGGLFHIRPSLQCRSWHKTDMARCPLYVRCWEQSRRHLLAASISPFDPGCVKTPSYCYDSPVILWGN